MTKKLAFLIGLPHSGASAIARALKSNPEILLFDEARPVMEHLSLRHYPSKAFPWEDEGRKDSLQDTAEALREEYELRIGFTAKKVIVDKSVAYYRVLPFLKEHFPAAQYIVVVRNPADRQIAVWQEWAGSPLPKEAHLIRCRPRVFDWWWGGYELRKLVLENPDKCLEIKFEDYLAQPDQVLRRVCEFLQVSCEPGADEAAWDRKSPLLDFHDGLRPLCGQEGPTFVDLWKTERWLPALRNFYKTTGQEWWDFMGYGADCRRIRQFLAEKEGAPVAPRQENQNEFDFGS